MAITVTTYAIIFGDWGAAIAVDDKSGKPAVKLPQQKVAEWAKQPATLGKSYRLRDPNRGGEVFDGKVNVSFFDQGSK